MRLPRCFAPTRRSSLPVVTPGYSLNASSSNCALPRPRRLREPGILDRSRLDCLHRIGEFAITRLRNHPLMRNLPAVDVPEVAVIDLRWIEAEVRIVVVHQTLEHAGVLLEVRLDFREVLRPGRDDVILMAFDHL